MFQSPLKNTQLTSPSYFQIYLFSPKPSLVFVCSSSSYNIVQLHSHSMNRKISPNMLEKLDSTPDKPSFRLMNHDDNKFLSKILSRETVDVSPSDPSSRVYYGSRSGSVPFFWESEPGTPKHALHKVNAPPLTPPPAYNYLNSSSDHSSTHKKLLSRSNFLRFLFLLKASPNSRSNRSVVSKSSTESTMAQGRPSYIKRNIFNELNKLHMLINKA